MGAVTSTALDLLTGALRKINVLAAGEPLDATDAADGLQVLNDLLESLSTDRLYVYSSNYSKLAWNPGQYDYTIGNPTQGSFIGACTVGTPYLTGVVSTLTLTYGLNAAGVRVGGTITDTLGLLPSGPRYRRYRPIPGSLPSRKTRRGRVYRIFSPIPPPVILRFPAHCASVRAIRASRPPGTPALITGMTW